MQYELSIIIPAYNEENRIERALKPTINFLNQKNYISEILVVNDGSIDKTKEVVESYKKNFANLKIIDYSTNKGKGYAVKTGMLQSTGKYRLFMDADYAVPIEFAERFIENAQNGYDIVIGSRENKESKVIKHQSFLRESLAKLFNLIQRAILGLPIKDTQCGFKLFTANSAERLFNALKLECALFDAELLYIAYKNNYKIKEIGVTWTHDQETRLPITLSRAIDLFIKLIKIRKSKQLQI